MNGFQFFVSVMIGVIVCSVAREIASYLLRRFFPDKIQKFTIDR